MDEYINEPGILVEQKPQDLTITLPKVKGVLPGYWDAEFIKERIEEAKNPSHQTFYRFLWMTGVRVTEAINVRKADIDFQNYTARIRWLKSRKWNQRTIPLHPNLRDILQVFTAPLKAEDFLFPFTRQRAFQLVKRDFGGGSPHWFRHSFAVNWLRCGGKIEVLCQMLGHSNIRTTMIYLQIVPVDIGKELLKIRF